MNKKGFTLIELIVTIALLAMISLISFVSINKAIQKSKDNECENISGSIKNAALVYFSDHRYNNPTTTVNAKILVSNGYLKEKQIKNPYGGSAIDLENNTTIIATINSSNNKITVTGLPNNCKKYS